MASNTSSSCTYQQQHRPSPHSIAVSALIALHCEEHSPLYYYQHESHPKKKDPTTDSDASTMLFHAVDRFLQTLLVQMSSSSTSSTGNHSSRMWSSRQDASVQELLRQLADATSESVALQLKGWLMVLVGTAAAGDDDDNDTNKNKDSGSSVDGLIDFMATCLQSAVRDGRVDASSCHGIYLRQTVLGFEALSFERVVELWTALKRELLEPPLVLSSWTRSAPQMEEAIRRVVWQQQHQHKRFTQTELEEMQTQVTTVLQHHPDLPSAHFLRFLLCLETGERAGALQSLHEYLDYAMILHQQQASDNNNSNTAAASLADLNVLPLAPILNAVLHQHFGEHALLAAAVEEAVCVAQQQPPPDTASSSSTTTTASSTATTTTSSSTECTAYALGWLATISNNNAVAAALLQRCVDRCRPHPSLRALQAGALLQRAALTRDWRPLQESMSALPLTTSTSTSTTTNSSVPHHHHAECGPTALPLALPTLARPHAVAAGIWHAYGVPTLAGHALGAALSTSTSSSPDAACPDAAWAINQRVRLGGNHRDSEHSNGSVYGEALRSLIELREQHHLSLEDGDCAWQVGLILHEWAVRRGELDQAESIRVELYSHVHPRLVEDTMELAVQTALLRSRQGRYFEAQTLLRETIAYSHCHSTTSAAAVAKTTTIDTPNQAQLLWQLALVHLECARRHHSDDDRDCGVSATYTAALAPLLECLTVSKRHGWTGVHAVALSLLGPIHLHLFRNRHRAQAVVRAALPQLVQDTSSTGLWLQGEAYWTLAQCHGTNNNNNTNNNKKQIRAALADLQRAEVCFATCDDVQRLRDVYYWQARLYHQLPDAHEARDQAAAQFVRLESSNLLGTVDPLVFSPASRPTTNKLLISTHQRDQLLQLAGRRGPAAPIVVCP